MRITKMVLLVNSLLWVVTPGSAAAPEPAKEGAAGCRELALGSRVDLHSPSSVYVFDTADGLRAVSWTNQLTAHELGLGAGPEVEFDLGLPGQPLKTPKLRVTKSPTPAECAAGQAVFELTADDPPASVIVTYRSDATRPVLRKFVKITNCSGQEWDRLLNIRLGEYAITKRAYAPAGDERGFPVYLDDQYFMTLAHPAGLAHVHDGKVVLQQYPGARLAPGATFECIEAVYGVATVGSARQAFLDHLTSRMRRTVRGHDKPYAIFEPFGARPGGDFNETEPFVLDSIAQVGQGQRDAGCHFDLYSVDFWVDYHGTLKECDPKRFPRGLQPIRAELDKLDTALGLWIDSSFAQWSIGGNPQVQGCLNVDPNRPETQREVSWGRQSFCRATEPIKSMYTDAFRHHVREHGVRLLKFDNLASVCVNPNHDHLPGVYSTEPIYDAVIDFLRALDRECPDVFLMLYWGYRSPWWLLHGDTLFDSGLGIEAASPSTFPAPHARDSVTQRLDQAQWHAGDVPPLGKDSLGIWLSDWGWNSSIGKERWQEGLVMDLCRGSLLAQPWSDTPWLSPPERQQMAEFIALLKARPECFRQPRFIVGDPRRDEPYGYCCSDGARAFVALYNCAWKDNAITLRLNPDWGLPAGRRWELYRWYPDTAKLLGGTEGLPETAVIGLRPFDVVLLEVVPLGQTPTLDRAFETRPLPVCFQVASQSVDIDVRYVQDRPDPAEMSAPTAVDPAQTGATGATGPTTPIPARSQPASARLVVCGRVPAAPQGGLVVVTVEMMSRSGTPTELRNVGEHFSANGRLDGQPAAWQPVLGTATYPSCWQAWRLALGPATQAREIALHITADIAPDVDLRCRGYFIAR
ncbi:MAG: hypothetical protein A2W31_10385 [Planctomycetes bacterium RBG_16_64_10]|nr:MAG: hypothetical protein A2W31_10385 [Planctomycetes bacterium RBG_16_64_10]